MPQNFRFAQDKYMYVIKLETLCQFLNVLRIFPNLDYHFLLRLTEI